MKTATINDSSGAPLQAVLRREVRGSISSRYFQVFCAIALAGGIAATVFAEDASAAGLFILQLALYCVSLFAVLLGVNSARAESQEWPLLFSQPIPRSAFLIGKFLALALIFTSALLLLFLPALFTAARSLQLVRCSRSRSRSPASFWPSASPPDFSRANACRD